MGIYVLLFRQDTDATQTSSVDLFYSKKDARKRMETEAQEVLAQYELLPKAHTDDQEWAISDDEAYIRFGADVFVWDIVCKNIN